MKVNTLNASYQNNLPAWQMCDDFVSGTRAVKAKKQKYLPRPNPKDTTDEANARYENYLNRAVFYEYSKKIVNQYIGLSFKQDPICEVNEVLENLKKNVDGLGTTLYQQAQKGFKSLLCNGRFGIWVDYPIVEQTLNKEQQKNIQPKILFYTAQSIINWRIVDSVATLIVLHEVVEQPKNDDYFVVEQVEQWRELGIDNDGNYYVDVWRKSENGFYSLGRQYPRNGKGEYWKFIPFQIFGSQYNTFDVQDIPIEPLVHIEKGIYQNSADAENSRFFCGQIQPFMNVDSQTRDFYTSYDANGQPTGQSKLRVGSETVIMLGENGQFGYAVAPPNSMATQGIIEKREIIAELGFQLGQAGSAVKTATQADNEAQAQHSVASLCVANLNEGFLNVLLWCNAYVAVDDEPKFQIRQEFSLIAIDVNLLNTVNALVDGGKLPKTVIFDLAKKYNLLNAELSTDDILGMIEADKPSIDLDD